MTTVFSGLQWRELKSSTEDTRTAVGAAKAQAEAAKEQADATRSIAEASSAQVQAMLDQQRAYIGGFNGAVNQYEKDEKITSTVMLKNFGQPTTVWHYTIHRTYATQEFPRLLTDDAHDHFAKDCASASIDDASIAKFHTENLGVLFPSLDPVEQRPIEKTANDVSVDDDLINGSRVYVRLDCMIYQQNVTLKHTLTCFYIKEPFNLFAPPANIVLAGGRLPPRGAMIPCEGISFAE